MSELLRRHGQRPFAFAAGLSALLLVANVVAEPRFGSPSNWPTQLASFAPLALVALASTPAILAGPGHLDLSVAPLMVLCNVLLGTTFIEHGIDQAWSAIPLVVLVGLVVGACNGVLVTHLRYQPVIATLCTYFVLTGVTLKIGATPKALPAANWTTGLGDSLGPVPGALLLLGAAGLVWWGLGRTAFHRSLYAVGGNDASAFSAGVDVHRTRILAYALGGGLAALAGIALIATVQSTQPGSGATYILIALAGVALGGTHFTGGRGGLLGSLVGALAIYLIQTLLSALGVSPTWLQIMYGAMLLTGVLVGALVASGRRAVVAG